MKDLDIELEKLYRQFCSGDVQAQLVLYKSTEQRLFKYLNKLSYSFPGFLNVEDFMQITWKKLWEACSSYKSEAKFMNYLYTIAKQEFLDELRKITAAKRRPKVIDGAGNEMDPFSSFSDTEDFISDIEENKGKNDIHSPYFENSPYEHKRREEENLNLKNAIKELPKIQQQAYILHSSGYSAQEIAQITDEKHEAVRMQIRYAKQKLLRILDNN